MSWLVLVVASFATYRVARMTSQEDGPWDVFSRVRGRSNQATWVGRGLHCFFCQSFWLAGIVTLGLILTGLVPLSLVWLVWPGVAGVAAAIYQAVR